MLKYTVVVSVFLFFGVVQAVPVSVIDSGTDFNHNYFNGFLHSSGDVPGNQIDDDENGYTDDTYGWNFAENNSTQVNYDVIPSEFADYVRALDILMLLQAKVSISDQDFDWIRDKWTNEQSKVFRTNVSNTAQFSHGTHVAGISLKESNFTSEISALQIMPTVAFLPLDQVIEEPNPDTDDNDNSNDDEEIADEEFIGVFKIWAEENSSSWLKEIELLTYQQVRVANCSFGFGYMQASDLIKKLCKLNKLDCDADRVARLARHLLSIYKRPDSERLVDTNSNILFVMASGNDGLDNDVYPDEPGNYVTDNRITVASLSHDLKSLADFSNYGPTSVDVAAPGELIRSTYPQHLKGRMSGTSQAAPYVMGVAAAVLDVNSKLTASKVKQIILTTVDEKDWLKDKVLSSGVVNRARALKAAELSLTMPLDDAINEASLAVPDAADNTTRFSTNKQYDPRFTPDMMNFVSEIIQKSRPML